MEIVCKSPNCLYFSPLSQCVTVGHIAENCTSEQRLCYNCRQPGHESAACPQPRSVAAKQCYSCGGVGHIQAECPSLRIHGSSQKCYVRIFLRVIFPTVSLTTSIPSRIAVASAILHARVRTRLVRMVLPLVHHPLEGR